MTTPTGRPAWERANDHTAYGGHLQKTNYQGVDSVNGRTDLSAQNLCRIAADLEAVQRTAPWASFTFTCNDTAPAAPTINVFTSMIGATEPTGARVGDGEVTFTWAATYNDPYSVPGTINIVAVTATVLDSTARTVTAEIVDSDASGNFNQIKIRAWTIAGAALADATVCVSVYTGPTT
jgi:hypothetical protein